MNLIGRLTLIAMIAFGPLWSTGHAQEISAIGVARHTARIILCALPVPAFLPSTSSLRLRSAKVR
jgi:hypothetical protein